MSDAGTNTPVRKSLDEIAAMMAENTQRMRGQLPNEVTPDAAEDTVPDQAEERPYADGQAVEQTTGEDAQLPDADENTDGDVADEEGQLQDDDNADDDAQLEAADDDFDMEIGDDTVFQLDDETEVSFKDLKQLYTADKDTLELVETQRTATQEALSDRQKAIEETTKARRAAEAVFEHFDRIISTPQWGRPDESLKTSNPQEYIQRLDYYQQDQERIAQQKRDLAQAFDQHLEAEKEIKQSLKRQTITTLVKEIPALASSDEAVKQGATKDILNAAEYYGFSPEEVNEATDPRLYKMAYEAEQYRKIMSKSTTAPKDEEEKKTRVKNQTRTLRPRGTTAKDRLSAQAKRVKVAKATAKNTGKVDDVAAFIAANRSR